MQGPLEPRARFLERVLRGITTPTEIRITTLTEPPLRKQDDAGVPVRPHFAGLRKRAVLWCRICDSYADAVNCQRIAEGKPADFRPQPRKGGERVGDTALIRGREELLLEVLVLECESVQYEIDGVRVPHDLVEPWLQPSRNSGAHQGLERPVIYRTIGLSHIEDLELLTRAVRVAEVLDAAAG